MHSNTKCAPSRHHPSCTAPSSLQVAHIFASFNDTVSIGSEEWQRSFGGQRRAQEDGCWCPLV